MATSYIFVMIGLVATNMAVRFNDNFLSSIKDVEIVRNISRCTGKAAEAVFTPSNDISIIMVNQSHYPNLYQEMLKETFANRTVKVFTKIWTQPIDQSHSSVRDSSFVLIANHVNCAQLMKDLSFERWAEYIIVTESTIQWLSKLSEQLWNFGFIRVAFVRLTSNGSTTFLRPIQNPLSRGLTPSLTAFNLCNKNLNSTVTLPGYIQQVIIAGHPFSSMLHIPTNATLKFAKIMEGTESRRDRAGVNADGRARSLGVHIMQMFAVKHSIKLVECDWENRETSIWMDAMDRCVAGEFDFFYGRELPSENKCCEHVSPITWYIFETLIFTDRLKSGIHSLLGLLLPYRRVVWFCTFTLLGLFALFAYAIDTLWSRKLIRERITMLRIWSIFVGQSLPVLPEKFSLRFVLGLWILYSLNNNLLYTSTFSSRLTASDNINILTTFQDILDSDRPICGSNKTKQLINDTKNPVMVKIRDRLEPVVSTTIFSKMLNENYIGSRHLSYILSHNWINRANSSLRLYPISKALIVNYPLTIFAKKRHPYINDFNTMVSNIRDAGITDNLYERYYIPKLRQTREQEILATTDEPFLSLKHLQFVFYILFIGHLISGIVFVIEVYMSKRLINRRNI